MQKVKDSPLTGRELLSRFPYLRPELDDKRQIGPARAAFQAQVPSARHIMTTTKLWVYETLVLSCFLYNSETWTMKRSSEQNVFEMACLRRILGVTLRNRLRNNDIKKHLPDQPSLQELVPNSYIFGCEPSL